MSAILHDGDIPELDAAIDKYIAARNHNQQGGIHMSQQAIATPASTKVVTDKVRFCFTHLLKPYAQSEGQEPKYSVMALIPKSDKKTVRNIENAIEAARLNSAALFGGKVPANLRSPLHDGDGPMPMGGEYGPECKGHYVLNCSSKRKPGVIDRFKNPITDEEDLYSGCYGRLALNFYAYSNSGNKGIAAGLNNAQKIAEGDFLGGGSRAEDDFDEWNEDEDDLLG